MKPWHHWCIFAACLAVVLSAMAWISILTLRLDRSRNETAHQAVFEENVRLALWRMENLVSPMLARESARPYFAYSSFYPAERAYTRMFEPIGDTEIMVPSPLLTEMVPHVLLHFQIDPDGQLHSPKVPLSKSRTLSISVFKNADLIQTSENLLAQLKKQIHTDQLFSALPDAKSYSPDAVPVVFPPESDTASMQTVQKKTDSNDLAQQRLTPAQSGQSRPSAAEEVPNKAAAQQVMDDTVLEQRALHTAQAEPVVDSLQTTKNRMEWNARTKLQQKAAQRDQDMEQKESYAEQTVAMIPESSMPREKKESERSFSKAAPKVTPSKSSGTVPAKSDSTATPPGAKSRPATSSSNVREGIMKPFWIGDSLFLARRVTVNSRDYIQGCWLDWPNIRTELLSEIHDLLPAAELQPALRQNGTAESRLLAGLPVQLIPGSMPAAVTSGFTPVQIAIVIAWVCVLLGAGAVGVLLAGVVALSERRAAFVSAVTHELRTPLTTFRMYSEMLAADMVPDEARRREYLDTLCAEGNRLSHLVENVLSYARLERGRIRSRMETVALPDIIERTKDRLLQRAEQVGMSLVIEPNPSAHATEVRVDISAMEQILFNLVDNACKYAVAGPDKRIHIETLQEPGHAILRVRDHGPGISPADARRLFTPFTKSAQHAAESAPGVGLGLALSRRLARQMQCNLTICPGSAPGACFEIRIPALR